MVLPVSLQAGSEAGAGVPREGARGLALDWPPGSTSKGCPGAGPACC